MDRPTCRFEGCTTGAKTYSKSKWMGDGTPTYRLYCRKHERMVYERRYRYRLLKKDYCELCGFKSKHPCQLDVDHIDGDKNNNDDSNLQTLCANCHRLKTFLSKDWLSNVKKDNQQKNVKRNQTMPACLYRKGKTHTVRGVECEMQKFPATDVPYQLTQGWVTDPTHIENPPKDDDKQSDEAKLAQEQFEKTGAEIMALADELGEDVPSVEGLDQAGLDALLADMTARKQAAEKAAAEKKGAEKAAPTKPAPAKKAPTKG